MATPTKIEQAIELAIKYRTSLAKGALSHARQTRQEIVDLVGVSPHGVMMLPTCVVDEANGFGARAGFFVRMGFVPASEMRTEESKEEKHARP